MTLRAETSETALARAAWSRVVEPADEVAGMLVGAVGPVAGLRWLCALGTDADLVTRGVSQLMDRLEVDDPRVRQRLVRAVGRWSPRLRGLDPRRDVVALHELGGRLVTPEDEEWPSSLDDLGAGAPLCLWVRGEGRVDTTLARSVSLVGARASTDYGDRVAGEMAAALADHGFGAVSGGAYGIDAAAHRGSLAAGGTTVAFLAGGVDRLYPAGNAQLLRAVAERGGLLVSEVPPGGVPSRVRFLKRNRLIAAASSATVVVEAAWRSGSLATAGRAFELLRPVGAVPGPVTSMASAGCHRLLRDGRAVCVTDADDVRELAGSAGADRAGAADRDGRRDSAVRRPHDGLELSDQQVFDALPVGHGTDLTVIVREAGVSVDEAMASLGRLEMRGLARRDPSGWSRAMS
ncbi:DNA-processing protein DprA [Sanguibacter sp. 25GB23B1]|uniref:DNA-processing protein DprA n=1 Tax=unclassified Sanguibacter TaxID=2645534 RepID=UPI0032B00754